MQRVVCTLIVREQCTGTIDTGVSMLTQTKAYVSGAMGFEYASSTDINESAVK